MLKLEKISKSRELSVFLRSKPTLFTAPFLFALAYAVFVHALAFFLFEITPFKAAFQTSLFTPVNVAIDLPAGIYTTHLDIQESEPIPPHIIAPLPEMPKLPVQINRSLLSDYELMEPKKNLNQPFLSLESLVGFNEFETKAILPAPVTISLSGEISKLNLIKKAYDDVLEEDNTVKEYSRFIYNVRVDLSRGEICWWDLICCEKKSQSHQAFKILNEIKFTPELNSTLSSGQIEIILAHKGA